MKYVLPPISLSSIMGKLIMFALGQAAFGLLEKRAATIYKVISELGATLRLGWLSLRGASPREGR